MSKTKRDSNNKQVKPKEETAPGYGDKKLEGPNRPAE